LLARIGCFQSLQNNTSTVAASWATKQGGYATQPALGIDSGDKQAKLARTDSRNRRWTKSCDLKAMRNIAIERRVVPEK